MNDTDRTEDAISYRFQLYQQRSTEKSRDFQLSHAEFRTLVLSECFYCGMPANQNIAFPHMGTKIHMNGVDRIDSGLGYVGGNVVPCCSFCNFSKGDSDAAAWLSWTHRVAQRTQGFPGTEELNLEPPRLFKAISAMASKARARAQARKASSKDS